MAAVTDLSTLDAFRDHLGFKATEVSQNDALAGILTGVSSQILTFISREMIVKERVELLDVRQNQDRFVLKAAPVHSLSEVAHDTERTFGTESILEARDYEWQSDLRREHGVLKLDRIRLRSGLGCLRVTYVGGWAFDTDYYISRIDDPSTISPSTGDVYLVGGSPVGDFLGQANSIATRGASSWTFETAYEVAIKSYPQLHTATLIQASYIYRTRKHQGTQQVTFRQASAMTRSIGLLHPVRDMLRDLQNKMLRSH